ncbi:MAG: DMT family transporter [Rhizobiales bacterium]|nr:DMT family transporter [Hyphomicrobiales bacterium]
MSGSTNTKRPAKAAEQAGLALGLTLAAAFLAAILLTMPKYAATGIHPFQITFFRYVTGLTVLLVFYGVKAMWGVDRSGERNRFSQPYENWTWLHIIRAAMATARVTSAFAAVSLIPLANAQAVMLTNGVFMMLFAAIFLGEKVPAAAIWLGAACLGGGFLAADPDLGDPTSWYSLGAGLSFFSAVMYGLESVIIKFTAERDHNRRILFVVNCSALVFTSIPAYFLWTPVTPENLWFLLPLGPIAVMIQVCNMEALRRARSSIIVPMRYTVVVFGVLIGIMVFGEYPSVQAIIGMTIITISGVFLAWLTNNSRRKSESGSG